MDWMIMWWESLSTLARVMAFFAIPMSIVMVVQLILMIIGIGLDSDMGNESDSSSDSASPIVKMFTIRGIVAFFAIGGWAGLAAITTGLGAFWAVQIAVLSGVCALVLASLVIRLARTMQSSGNLDISNAPGHVANVYIRIPAMRSSRGKITMLLQERFVELDAVTDCDSDLLPSTKVKVVDIDGDDCVVVNPVI